MTYKKQGNYLTALEFYQKSSALFERLGAQTYLARVFNNMAALYELMGDHEMTLALYQQSLKLKQAGADQGRIPHTLNNIGHLYRQMGNPQEALVYLQLAEAQLRTSTDKLVLNNNASLCQPGVGHGRGGRRQTRGA